MSNLVRKLENEITNSDHEQEDGSAFIRFPLKFFLPLLGLLLALASINSGLIYFDLLTPTAISPYISSFTVLTLITLTAFIAPLEVGALSLLVTFLYFNLYSIPSYMTQAAVYGICIALASWFLAGRLLRGSLKILQVDKPQLVLSQALFFITIFSQAFLLLTIKCFYQPVMFSFGVIWAFILCAMEREEIFKTIFAKPKLNISYSRLTSFFAVGILLLLEFSAVMYLYPGAIGGDSDKGYLALAKFFSRGNSILLSEPAVLRDGIRSFPYFEEIYLSAGYILSNNFGAKLFAWLIIACKFSTLYFVATRVISLSIATSLGLVLCYGLIPYHIEIHSIERPENILTVFVLMLVYFVERANKALQQKNQVDFERLIIVAAVLSCVTISIKYTSLFFLAALALVYWRVCLKTLSLCTAIFKRGYLVLLPSIAVAAFWYIRNLILWGEVVSMTPFGQYHLTVLFPPLRGLSDIWHFIRDALVHTSQYTEFKDFGYGFWGIVFWGGVLAALTAKGPTRRLALLVLFYALFLFNSTRQIRYLLPVLPLGLAALFAFSRQAAQSRISESALKIAEPLVFIAILVQASAALVVNFNGVVGNTFSDRTRLVEKDMTRIEPLYSVFNDRVHYPDLILTSHFDANYNIDATLFRADPVNTVGELQKRIVENKPSYFLLTNPGVDITVPFFNDFEFFDSFAYFEVRAFNFVLFKVAPSKISRLLQYIEEKGWDANKTYIISEKLKQTFPTTYTATERINIPELKHPMYRVTAMRWSDSYIRKFGD